MPVRKAFYIMTFTPLWASVIEKLKDVHEIVPSLFIGMDPLPEVAFYDVNDARMAIKPSEIRGFEPAALDAELLAYYAERQSVVLEMISRFSLGKKSGSYEQRREYMWEMIRIWEGLFDLQKPDVVIAGSMPHRVFDYVVYLICERKGIPFVALEATAVPHLFYVCTSIHNQSVLFEQGKFLNESLKPLSEETQKFYEYVRAADPDYKPYNLSLSGLFTSYKSSADIKVMRKEKFKTLPQFAQIALTSLLLLLRGQAFQRLRTRFDFNKNKNAYLGPSAVPVTKISNQILALRASINVGAAEKWYKRNCEVYDTQKPFVYFAANFMPERSTVPDSGYFYDYCLIFSMLERVVPKDWRILYKEHPRSFRKPVAGDNPRDIDFFLRLRRACPRLIFLDKKTDSKALIRDAAIVATASGTSGWEAVTRGKPVLLFGQRWYGSCEGVYTIHGMQDLRAAFADIQKNPAVPERNVIQFLQRLESVSEDMAYYYKDNIEERSRLSTANADRSFSQDELRLREDFSLKMAAFLKKNIDKVERSA